MSERKIRTMEEFATACGVSRPTVSKYFNEPESVKKSTRDRIEKALKDFDYRPNIFAINLNRKKPKNIGVIVPHISDPFYAEVVRQIEMRCLREGYWVIVLSSHGDRELEANAIRTLQSLKLSGAIIAPLGFDSDLKLIDSLREQIPLVFFDSRIDDGTPFVGTDNAQSISHMVDYLLRTGENPCFLEMPSVNQNAVERRDTYIRTMEQRGVEPIVLPARSTSWSFEELGFVEANRILDEGGFPTRTVLCANDRLAFGVIAAAFGRRLKVGIDPESSLRVAGHDDHPLSRFTCPPLTTVAQDYQGIASVGFDMLLARIGQKPKASASRSDIRRLDAKLIMRGSA
ncbi:LacI family DNA-binding transcriptional regulator [Pseudaminobacter soli (ex Li et al. 2025)]|uniref:LacI family transcriptional regulator n=1 Tax=Pseudaminobacter soli (ex Li et al. 2025) TaxID=1295366 RepID=A0A2P7S1W0_9HYPH|nr:LacI family DNA-binding transcriptional regulator [Mesorhizobium soli]PSJ56441.1 LacI family transcriptional regulator [Mesorhizobium soli]